MRATLLRHPEKSPGVSEAGGFRYVGGSQSQVDEQGSNRALATAVARTLPISRLNAPRAVAALNVPD